MNKITGASKEVPVILFAFIALSEHNIYLE
jgi:hypothetical protein